MSGAAMSACCKFVLPGGFPVRFGLGASSLDDVRPTA
jgi:hypothetical protein